MPLYGTISIHKKMRVIGRLVMALFCILSLKNMFFQPELAFEGAVHGLLIWWRYILPSLLPFYILTELLMRLGIIRFFGSLLEPIMRLVFNLPGVGGFTLIMGLIGGAPINGSIASNLRKENLLSRGEGERLIAVTSFCSPSFMLAAVAVGMLERPELGLLLAGTHYLSAVGLGILWGLYIRRIEKRKKSIERSPLSLLKSAFQSLLAYYRDERGPFGELLGDSISTAIHKLLYIGGFIVLFSVLIEFISSSHLFKIAARSILHLASLPPLPSLSLEGIEAFLSGLIETTVGTQLAVQSQMPIEKMLITISGMLGWAGVSLHAQQSSMVADSDLRLKPYLLFRILHALLAAILTWILYGLLEVTTILSIPTSLPLSRPLYSLEIVAIFLGSGVLLLLSLSSLSLLLLSVRQKRIW